MKKRHQLGQGAMRLDKPGRHFLGMRGGVAYALYAGYVVDVLQQHGEVGDVVTVAHGATIGIDVLPQQGDLFDALIGQVGDLYQDVIEGPGNLGAARVRYDTEAAVLAAAFHDGDKGGGPIYASGGHRVEFFDFGKADIDLGTPLCASLGDQFGQAVQGLRSEDDIDIGRALDDGVAFLAGHAAAYTDDQVGIALLQVLYPSEIGKHFFLRFLAYRTGVEQNDVCFVGILRQFDALGLAQDIDHLV